MLRDWSRSRFVRVLYAMGEACFLVADRFAPSTDEIWRDRRWKQYLRNESRLDAYEIPDHVVPSNSYCRIGCPDMLPDGHCPAWCSLANTPMRQRADDGD